VCGILPQSSTATQYVRRRVFDLLPRERLRGVIGGSRKIFQVHLSGPEDHGSCLVGLRSPIRVSMPVFLALGLCSVGR
jgi:hypothetical protein